MTFVFSPPVLSLDSPELSGSISHSGLLSASYPSRRTLDLLLP